MKIDRSKLAIWAEGTRYTTDELASMYDDYLVVCAEDGTEPEGVDGWCSDILGLTDEIENV